MSLEFTVEYTCEGEGWIDCVMCGGYRQWDSGVTKLKEESGRES